MNETTYTISPEVYKDKKKRARALTKIHADANRKPRSPLIIELGKTIRERRESKKLTLEEVEQLSGIGFSYLIKIEKGRANISVQTLERIAAALELDLRIELVRPKNSNQ
jgi:ribosome-binding protein aMBF1 (putative translation factor)